MIDEATRKRISNLREMAMMVVEEADEVLRDTEPGSSLQGSQINQDKKSGLSDRQRAELLMKRKKNVARGKYLKTHK